MRQPSLISPSIDFYGITVDYVNYRHIFLDCVVLGQGMAGRRGDILDKTRLLMIATFAYKVSALALHVVIILTISCNILSSYQ